MRYKHIKTWLFVFVGTLAVASGAASFFAQQKTLYNGLEPLKQLKGNFAQTSVLSAQPTTIPQAAAQAAAPEIQTPPAEIPAESQQTAEPQQTPALIKPVSSPCGADEKPVIKNSQISGCTKINTPLQITNYQLSTNSLAPKIKILETQSPKIASTSPASCESQGRFTYTGEDRPGLLYGMCIDCLTTQFAANDGACKK